MARTTAVVVETASSGSAFGRWMAVDGVLRDNNGGQRLATRSQWVIGFTKKKKIIFQIKTPTKNNVRTSSPGSFAAYNVRNPNDKSFADVRFILDRPPRGAISGTNTLTLTFYGSARGIRMFRCF